MTLHDGGNISVVSNCYSSKGMEVLIELNYHAKPSYKPRSTQGIESQKIT